MNIYIKISIYISNFGLLFLGALILYREVFILKMELWVQNIYEPSNMLVGGKTVSLE